MIRQISISFELKPAHLDQMLSTAGDDDIKWCRLINIAARESMMGGVEEREALAANL